MDRKRERDNIEEGIVKKKKVRHTFKKFEVKNEKVWEFIKDDEEFEEFRVVIDKVWRRRRIPYLEEEILVKFVRKYVEKDYENDPPWLFLRSDISNEKYLDIFDSDNSYMEYVLENKSSLLKYINAICFLEELVSGKRHQDLYMSIGAKIEGKVDKYVTGGGESADTRLHKSLYKSICCKY